jgi:hypothetical protein
MEMKMAGNGIEASIENNESGINGVMAKAESENGIMAISKWRNGINNGVIEIMKANNGNGESKIMASGNESEYHHVYGEIKLMAKMAIMA